MIQQNIYIAFIYFVLYVLFEVEDRSLAEVCQPSRTKFSDTATCYKTVFVRHSDDFI